MPWWRSALFFSGLVALVLALASGIEILAGDLFSIHMLQHMLLTIVAAPLLMLGAPVQPLLRGLPAVIRAGVVRPLARATALRTLLHVLRHPLVAVTIFLIAASGAFFLWLEMEEREQRRREAASLVPGNDAPRRGV